MPFEIVRNNIANMQVDAIVNAADRYPQVNPGVDGAIHQKAGPQLLAARKEIGEIAPGSAAVTPAFLLDAQFVIHAVTPTWEVGEEKELQLLRQTYDACLQLAQKHKCESIAFPLLATGNHGFPKDKALQIAVGAFSEFLLKQDMHIYLVVFDGDSYRLSEKLVQKVTSYIDRHYVDAYEKATKAMQRRRREPEMLSMESAPSPMAASVGSAAPVQKRSLMDFLRKKDAGFRETLLDMIKKRGLKNATVYKRANISKQHFSKLINDPEARPSKATALALALALELNLDETKDLIGRAGYALTNSNVFDLIIQFHIENRQYNVLEINLVLYQFDQTLLGTF